LFSIHAVFPGERQQSGDDQRGIRIVCRKLPETEFFRDASGKENDNSGKEQAGKMFHSLFSFGFLSEGGESRIGRHYSPLASQYETGESGGIRIVRIVVGDLFQSL
jgi:hypothetical protein